MINRATGLVTRVSHTGPDELLTKAGERVPLDGRRPRLLDDPSRALFVNAGHVDLFAVLVAEGAAAGARRHLCRIEAGDLILGLPFVECEGRAERVGVLAAGGQGAEAQVIDRALIDGGKALEIWIARLCSAIPETAAGWGAREAEPGAELELKAGQQLRAPARGVAWILVDRGEIRLVGSVLACRAGDPPLPLASGTWAEPLGDACVRVLEWDAVFGADPWPAIDRFHALAMACIAVRLAEAQNAELRQLDQRVKHAATQGAQIFSELSAVLVPRGEAGFHGEGADPLLEACRLAAEAIGAIVVAPPNRRPTQQAVSDVAEIARASRLRSRRVLLREDWWQRNVGPLVAWYGEARDAVAIIPTSPGRYVMVHPGIGRTRRVDARVAAELSPAAVMFYAPLPSLTGSAVRLLIFCAQQGYADVVRILLSALAMGVLALVTPLITEVLIDSVIPRTELDQLVLCAGGLAMAAIGAAGFQVLESGGTLSLEGRLDRILQAGIVDRLLQLPVSFFKQYTAGDLADRVLGIESIRRIATGRTVRGLLASLFSLFSFALMFYYDIYLALIAATLTVLRGLIIVLTSAMRLRRERRHSELVGKVQGFVLQLLTGVGKLRVAFGTGRALKVWAGKFAEQKRQFIGSQRAANLLKVFEAGFPIAATLTIFAAAGHGPAGTLTTGQFLAFYVAFGQSLAAVGELADAIGESLVMVPLFNRLQSLMAEPAEMSEHRNPPGELSGAFELGQVTFRYAPRGPIILNKVTMHVEKGEYVALVGPSGGGKSTIFRLLLGFEKPESGSILFDGKEIDTLDVAAVRRQIGVVLQNGKLTPGSLYENICCGAELPMTWAWEAAGLAGLTADIEAMPMGMHTVIGEGMNTLSGGQRQQLMIARALVCHPRILLFDEATSALDNRTQAIVSTSLAKLNATRIVIAQRLSTVKSADRIIVLASGEIVQAGVFEELSAAPGLFADFARRQLL
jgi:NHLM bacteriocin system ABC transporter ATP-binding protein